MGRQQQAWRTPCSVRAAVPRRPRDSPPTCEYSKKEKTEEEKGKDGGGEEKEEDEEKKDEHAIDANGETYKENDQRQKTQAKTKKS